MSVEGVGGKINLRLPSEFPTSRPAAPEAGANAPSFGGLLKQSIEEVSELQDDASERVEAFVRGEDVPLHEVVLAQEEAEISFRLLLQVRNNLVQAYQEIMRTPM